VRFQPGTGGTIYKPDSLAVDSTSRTVWVGTLSTGQLFNYLIKTPASGATATPGAPLGIGSATPSGLYFVSDAFTTSTLFLVDFTGGFIQSYQAGHLTTTISFQVPNLAKTSAGIVVCN
jgi:hypothetical protein